MTTLFAARREDLTAVLGAHALEETVDALASAVVRLKGPFHGTDSPNTRGKPKALYRTGLGARESREFTGLRMILILSTPVDSAVDKRLQERASNPCCAGVPAA